MTAPCVLVVESQEEDLRLIEGWLEDAGVDDVMFCPGPRTPAYTCIGSDGGPCPLSSAADVVVIDLRLRSDVMLAGTPAWQLLLSYYEQGKRIVAISNDAVSVRPTPDEQLRVVRRPLERESFIDAVNFFVQPVYAREGMAR